jgi:hypothetical protein
MILKPATTTKLEHIARLLAEEFEAEPDSLITSEVEATAARLLESARFDDYVPILAHRYVRARLRSGSAAPTLVKAA